MENQSPKRKRGDDDGDGDGEDVVSGSDRISPLPESVLLRILRFLSHKKAVQTSVLSKPWRHLGSTRPAIDLRRVCEYDHVRGINGVCENCFQGNNKAFISVLENTFQRYHDRNLFPHELCLEMRYLDSQLISVLHKWIPVFINPDKPAVTTFRLSFYGSPCFDLPSVVFKAEYLQNLYLHGCRLNEINSIDNILLKNLQNLSLYRVDVAKEALEKIIAGCPLVQRVVMCDCEGFKTISIGNKNRCLNSFEFSCSFGNNTEHSIEIDGPTLQSIRIVSSWSWFPNHSNYFPHLKSLFLLFVNLSTESFHNFSCNFPLLEELTLLECSGFKDVNMTSPSIKRLVIHDSSGSVEKVAIEVPNILHFEFSTSFNLPKSFSLMTTSRKWKSDLNLDHCLDVYDDDNFLRIHKLIEMVKALSRSQISLSLSESIYYKRNQIESDFIAHPVAVEHLGLDISTLCRDSLKHFLNALFRIFRPRYTNVVPDDSNVGEEVNKFLWITLIDKRGNTEYGWEQHLEEVSIEAYDEKGKVWNDLTCLPEWSKNPNIRFRLKWRD